MAWWRGYSRLGWGPIVSCFEVRTFQIRGYQAVIGERGGGKERKGKRTDAVLLLAGYNAGRGREETT